MQKSDVPFIFGIGFALAISAFINLMSLSITPLRECVMAVAMSEGIMAFVVAMIGFKKNTGCGEVE